MDTVDSLSSPRSVRADRNGNEIIAHSKDHSISFADEIPDNHGSPQSLETVIPVECYKDLNRTLSFEPRDTEFPQKKQSCLGGFKEFLHLLFSASDPMEEDYAALRSESYYM
ncbi:hypothetical protein FOZ61_000888 [Perkinsus olseni]|uniref:Uncharacterized protein n=1 Tax=Perkinsus olseni TaxID=32597 RepID=A0A7J6LYI0_PEROL|nr:hypothetical protein FOZ61_000888 [Perkinsus olseni]